MELSRAVFHLKNASLLSHCRLSLLSSEVYFADVTSIDTQLKWLEEDLKMANAPENRTAHPWIVAYGHR